MSNLSQRDPGSFRDPDGYVFSRESTVYRAINDRSAPFIDEILTSGLLTPTFKERKLIGTQIIEDNALLDQLRLEHPGYKLFLQHEKIPLLSYPHEWSASMLADAAILTLNLQLQLLNHGLSLKDATAYNIQFLYAQPTFIDFTSIFRPKRLDIWTALGQFYRMFYYPLLLYKYRGWDFRSYFVGEIGGRSLEQTAMSIRWPALLAPSHWLDLTLPYLLHKYFPPNAQSTAQRKPQPASSTDATAQIFNIKRILRKIERLRPVRSNSHWSTYTSTCTYSESAENTKKAIVSEFLKRTNPGRVVDLGCNTGDYSLMAAELGAEVTAVDADHDSVDLLYRRAKESKQRITSMIIDLCNPSPAVGFRNTERSAFTMRVNGDCVIALALLHHLLVTGNLSFDSIRDMLFDTTNDHLIIEFVPPTDEMFIRLTAFRAESFDHVNEESFLQAFCQRFLILDNRSIANSNRKLFLMKKQ